MKQMLLQTEQEFEWMKTYLLLPITLDVLERDIKTLETVSLKMPMIYVKTLRHVQDMVTADLATLAKMLKKHGIKVYEQHRTKIGIEAKYLCRGYHYQFSMLWSLVRAEIENKLGQYLNINLADDGVNRR